MPSVTTQESKMKKHLLMAGAVVAALAIPLAANAQSGAATGAVGGAVGGGISDDRRSGFRTYVVQEKRSSYKYDRDVVIGAELPSAGVTYYEVPAEYGVKDYRYTVVNNRTVLVDPRTHRIVQVIE